MATRRRPAVPGGGGSTTTGVTGGGGGGGGAYGGGGGGGTSAATSSPFADASAGGGGGLSASTAGTPSYSQSGGAGGTAGGAGTAGSVTVTWNVVTLTGITAPVSGNLSPAVGSSVNVPLSASATASDDGTLTYALTSGSLPSGLTVNSSTGAITGTAPTTPSTSSGLVITATEAATGLTNSTGSFTLNIVPGTATRLAFTQQPSTTVVLGTVSGGAVFAQQPKVTAYDSYGNVATGYAGTVTLADTTILPGYLFNNGYAFGAMNNGAYSNVTGNGCTGTLSSGVTTFSSCSFFGFVGMSYQLKATDGALSTTSNLFTVSGPSTTPAQLIFTTQPVPGSSGGPLSTMPVIAIEDTAGNVVTSSTATITLTGGGTGASLSGCTSLTAVAGIVSPQGCTFSDTVGNQYTVTAALSGTTSAVSTGYFGYHLAFTTQPASTPGTGTKAATALPMQPVVQVENANNAPVSALVGDSVSIELTSSGIPANPAFYGWSTGLPGAAATINSSGQATFSGIDSNYVGIYQLQAVDTTHGGVAPAVTTTPVTISPGAPAGLFFCSASYNCNSSASPFPGYPFITDTTWQSTQPPSTVAGGGATIPASRSPWSTVHGTTWRAGAIPGTTIRSPSAWHRVDRDLERLLDHDGSGVRWQGDLLGDHPLHGWQLCLHRHGQHDREDRESRRSRQLRQLPSP